MREEAPGGGGGEVIKSSTIPGGLLTSEICVLDDISRAPGEALNVLLRILNERRFGTPSEDIPLMTAIATSNPAGEDQYYAEPLDPANLDRFTIQLQASGLVQQGDWAAASAVIDLYASRDGREEVETVGRDAIEQAQVGGGAACAVCVCVCVCVCRCEQCGGTSLWSRWVVWRAAVVFTVLRYVSLVSVSRNTLLTFRHFSPFRDASLYLPCISDCIRLYRSNKRRWSPPWT
jgi:hypothetical protein